MDAFLVHLKRLEMADFKKAGSAASIMRDQNSHIRPGACKFLISNWYVGDELRVTLTQDRATLVCSVLLGHLHRPLGVEES